MEQFLAYLDVGFHHIIDVKGYDHILFVLVLCAAYEPKDYKKLLILATAFTLGHSVTLALATLNIIKINADFIEMLIPITIMITAVFNYFDKQQKPPLTLPKQEGNKTPFLLKEGFGVVKAPLLPKEGLGVVHIRLRYFLALFFGLIHGLGFSNFLRSLLLESKTLFVPLLAFNAGLEIGQLLIIAVLLLFCFIFVKILKMPLREWLLFLSGGAFFVAATIILGKIT